MDNDANAGALGEALYRRRARYRPLFYLTLSTGIGGGIVTDAETVYRGADSYAGEIGHLTVRPDGPECLCGARGCLERMCCGLWLERDYGRPASELLQDPAFVERYVVDLALGLEGRHHAAESGAHRHRRRHQQGGRPAVRAAARGAARGRLQPGRERASMWFRQRWETTACCMAQWHWPQT